MSELSILLFSFDTPRVALLSIFVSFLASFLLVRRREGFRNQVREPPHVPKDALISPFRHMKSLLRRRMQYWNDIGYVACGIFSV
jgi:hypothetical protein